MKRCQKIQLAVFLLYYHQTTSSRNGLTSDDYDELYKVYSKSNVPICLIDSHHQFIIRSASVYKPIGSCRYEQMHKSVTGMLNLLKNQLFKKTGNSVIPDPLINSSCINSGIEVGVKSSKQAHVLDFSKVSTACIVPTKHKAVETLTNPVSVYKLKSLKSQIA